MYKKNTPKEHFLKCKCDMNIESNISLYCCKDGKSAYEIAVEEGFIGSKQEWLDSLKGESGPFLSSYMEALVNNQTVDSNNYIIFDTNSVDSVGDNIILDDTGKTFTINKTGLYHIEWNLNLGSNTTKAVVGILENEEGASGSYCSRPGNFSSGTLINVEVVPFTIELYNYVESIELENPSTWLNSAGSIRIVRFADSAS